jgi:hypothetical protein
VFSSRFDQEKCLQELLLSGLRKRERKSASLAQASALRQDFDTHRLRQRLSDRQTNARASKGARTRLVDPVKAFKDVGKLFWLA